MYLQKVISRITYLKKKTFVGVLKVNDKNSRIWSRIQIRTKMLLVRNTAVQVQLMRIRNPDTKRLK
jgi:hypothetical protein